MNTWNIDTTHSEIAFKVKHLMVSTVRGTFGAFEGTISTPDDTFNGSTITFSADANTVNTKSDQRDAHLKAPDFFDAEKFPKLTFASTSVKKTGDKLEVVGNLTMKGVTKPVTLSATFNGISKGMDGKRVAGFDVTGSINREDFGLTWNAAVETGGVVVSEIVNLEISIEAKEA
jgi:polyisoprenoid-binding protein YceI